MAAVLAIIAIVTALSIAGLGNLKGGANFSSASGELVAGLRRTRAEAFGRSIQTAFVIDTVGMRWWGIEAAAGLDLDTFNPALPGTVIVSGTLPTGTTFGPAAGYGVALAAPMGGIPILAAASPNFPYCSFCRTSGTNLGFGGILFQSGAQATFTAGPSAIGQQFALTANPDGRARYKAVAIVARTGTIEEFER